MSTKVGVDGAAPQCQYMVPRKKRLCRMTVKPGRRYCGEHDRPDTSVDDLTPGTQPDARIPCPLDPKHTCYASKLERHLKVCNARSDVSLPYIDRGCNMTTPDREECRTRLKDVPTHTLKAVVLLVERIYKELIKSSIENAIESENEPVHPSVAEDYGLDGRQHSSRRHLRQTSSLIRVMEGAGLMETGCCYVELGAGKGHVSYYVARAVQHMPSCSVLLVDRASHRHKQDNKLDKSLLTVERIKADIGDLRLAGVRSAGGARTVVGVAKHVCGVATDYALRCVTAAEIVGKTRGVVIATCCHHRCLASSYVAMDYLQELGITREYFDIIMGIVSWATCGTGYSRERSKEIENKRRKITDKSEYDKTCDRNDATVEKNTDEVDYLDRDGINDCVTNDVKLRNIKDNDVNLKSSDNSKNVVNNTRDIVTESNDYCSEKHSENDNNSDASKAESSDNINFKNSDEDNSEIKEIETESEGLDKTESVLNDSVGIHSTLDAEIELTDDKGLGLTFEERENVGRHAKLILDYGRILYLRKFGFDSKLCYFVDTDVSKENVCIVAKK